MTKELSTRKCDSYGNYEIFLVGGGKKPAALDGIFTSKTLADNKLGDYHVKMGVVNEAKKLKEEIKSITPLDHTYDGV
tara:strand:+ start:6623 stop:6856 length:234 start_codon:yes stop_codon:yes gene_type:complete